MSITSPVPRLPDAPGRISAALFEQLVCRPPRNHLEPLWVPLRDVDPFGMDLQLALHVCYQLHYHGFAGVDPLWEWNAGLLHMRAQLERVFLAAVRQTVGDIAADATAEHELDRLAAGFADDFRPSHHLRDEGTWDQAREYFVHRSLYHLKEGDVHAWLIPRLEGQAKTSFATVEFDGQGDGSGARERQQLFADLMVAAGLDPGYLAYLDAVPPESLAVVNLMSMFGLHRRLCGSAAGYLAATELIHAADAQCLLNAMQRLDAPKECLHFYRARSEAAAVHEHVLRDEVMAELLRAQPNLDRDMVFGIRACVAMESRLADHLLKSWTAQRSSLSRPRLA